jgi:hypothetical protein
VTVEIAHPPGEEIQWDWLELHDTPWGRRHIWVALAWLVGILIVAYAFAMATCHRKIA